MTEEPLLRGSFAARAGEIRLRMDPKYVRGIVTTASALDGLRYPLVRLGDGAESIQYGLSVRADSDASGIAILRMVNLRDDGWDLSDLKYVPAEAADLKRMRLRRGDVLFNRTNSEELIGKCAVFDDPREFVFASYLIRVRLDTSRMLPEFLALFLATDIGRMQIDTVSRRIIGMANISASELRDLLIPMPPVSEQLAMATDANNVREVRSRLILEADALEAGIDKYVSSALDLPAVGAEPSAVFAVKASRLKGGRLDALSYRALAQLPGPHPALHIGDVVQVTPHKFVRPENESDLVPYVGLPECSLRRVREIAQRPYVAVKGRKVARPGDILFARIEPSVFNKKYVWAGDLLGASHAFVSTEFHVLTPRSDVIEPRFLYAMLFSSYLAAQVRGKTTGSSGRRRLDLEMLTSIEIPVPDRALQREIADAVDRRLRRAGDLRERAGQAWSEAKAQFLERLLRGAPE